MQVTVHYMAQLRRSAGCASEDVELNPCATVAALFIELAAAHGPEFRRLLLTEDHRPERSLLVFVGDERAGPGCSLRPGDVVTLLAPMAGG